MKLHLFDMLFQERSTSSTKKGERFSKIVIFTLMKMLSKCCLMILVKWKIDYSHAFETHTALDLLYNIS